MRLPYRVIEVLRKKVLSVEIKLNPKTQHPAFRGGRRGNWH